MARKPTERREPSFGGPARSSDDGFRADPGDREPAYREPPRQAGRPKKAPPARDARRRARGSFLGRFIRRLIGWALVACVWAGLAAAGVVAYYASTMPPIDEWAVPKRPPNVRIVSEGGDLIANRGDTGGERVPLADMPKWMPEAVVSIEDRRFYDHWGIDPIGMARAFVTNLTAGGLVQGGSTLTQQLAKNLFLEPERTLQRKVQEAILSFRLEGKYSKDEILDMYLNRVYLGAGAYGVDAAARRYFGVSARDLTLPQAAMIAGLLKAPTRFAPTRDLKLSQDRAAVVLGAMREENYITDAQLKQALASPAKPVSRELVASGGYVADWVMDQLPGFIGPVQQDVTVETTIDSALQRTSEVTLKKGLDTEGRKYGVTQGAVVILDGAGAVKALVGGRDYNSSQFDRAISAKRQPGSSFKPFVYLTALEGGMTPSSTVVDQPVKIGNWSPENYTHKYRGALSLTKALANSLNTVSVQLVMQFGPQSVVATAHRLGITSALEPNASIALGTSEVSLLELTSAYVPFSNGGFGVVPHVVRRIVGADGKVLYERRGGGPGQVVAPQYVGEMNAMLSEVILSGTGQRARIKGWPAAGKSGTSQNYRDAWFLGYTGYFTTGVWLGNDDGTPTKKMTGGTLPAKIWGELMTGIHAGMQVAELPGAQAAKEAAAAASAQVPDDGPVMLAPGQPGGAVPGAAMPAGQQPGAVVPAQPAPKKNFFQQLFGG
ncbi:PBP1A family penicillin-binding protein [Pseudoxanthobacter sp.]|uniref:transglycosylase domain-containing protein n=1 Tax=Pseudoxanthobacter sp. TaxID=1925742 RepID=UPI002FE00B2D